MTHDTKAQLRDMNHDILQTQRDIRLLKTYWIKQFAKTQAAEGAVIQVIAKQSVSSHWRTLDARRHHREEFRKLPHLILDVL